MFLKKIQFKLTMAFLIVFVMSTTVFHLLSFYSLYTSLRNDDHAALRSRLLSYWAQFQIGGMQMLHEELDLESLLAGERPALVRISERNGRTVLLLHPAAWAAFPLEELSRFERYGLEQVRTLKAPGLEFGLEVAAINLGERYVLQVGLSTEGRDRLLRAFVRNFVFVVVAISAVGFFLGLVLTARYLRPLGRLNEVITEILSTGEVSTRIERSETGDEFDTLIESFNRMLANIDGLLAGMRSTLDTVAHDLRTPVTRMRGVAEIALRGEPDLDRYREALSDCLEESESVVKLLDAIMELSEAESGLHSPSREPVELLSLLGDVVDLYSFAAEERAIRIEGPLVEYHESQGDWNSESAPEFHVAGDPARLRQMIANLLDNAVKYSPPAGTVRVSLQAGDSQQAHRGEPESYFTIKVEDAGAGIVAEELPYIWQRLYRGREAVGRPGLGIGLSLVKTVVEAHSGQIEVGRSDLGGALFCVRLPCL
ncbi:MAG: HAMP domain-containing protein [Spirochaetaceae bacterium]|nr:MAG: HAMP domain-containing protein [Spirochaetaceae bacterium]